MKLRINAILNGCTRRGSFLGNSLGVLGELLPSLPCCISTKVDQADKVYSNLLQHCKFIPRLIPRQTRCAECYGSGSYKRCNVQVNRYVEGFRTSFCRIMDLNGYKVGA